MDISRILIRILIWEGECRDGIVRVHSETFTKGTPTYIVTGPLANSSELRLLSGYSEKDAIGFALSRCGKGQD